MGELNIIIYNLDSKLYEFRESGTTDPFRGTVDPAVGVGCSDAHTLFDVKLWLFCLR